MALSAAVVLINKVAPEETPKKYAFGSWRHVLHEACDFEVRKLPAKLGGATRTWFRTVQGAN